MDKKKCGESRILGAAIIFTCLIILGFYFLYTRGGQSEGLNVAELKYYRAVLLVQQLDNLASLENEDVPGLIRYHDSTESLLHHHDPRIQLRKAAEDLASVRNYYPKARLFEAYGRWHLGETAEAVRLMTDYVAYAPFEKRYYAWLAHILRNNKDYPSLYLIATEWADRSGGHSHASAEHLWIALQSMHRYQDAHDFLLSSAPDFGWKKEVMLAKTLCDLGMSDEGYLLLRNALETHVEDQLAIEFFWQSIKDLDSF